MGGSCDIKEGRPEENRMNTLLIVMSWKLEAQGFYGPAEAKAEHGHVTVFRKSQSCLPDDICHRNKQEENTWTPKANASPCNARP
jgi:hypothetical protein